MQDMSFRCYTEKSLDGQYYAICLDLSLIDKRETLDEAIAALDENILGYLASVQAHGDAATAIPRPVSFGGWLRFYRLSILNTLLLLFGRRVDGFLAYAKKQAPTLAPVTKLAYA
jgi:predicted RNase H-like HicB family nuclease